MKPTKREGEVAAPPSVGLIKIDYRFIFFIENSILIFQILKDVFTSIFKIFGRFFLTPFQAVQISLL